VLVVPYTYFHLCGNKLLQKYQQTVNELPTLSVKCTIRMQHNTADMLPMLCGKKEHFLAIIDKPYHFAILKSANYQQIESKMVNRKDQFNYHKTMKKQLSRPENKDLSHQR